MQVGDFVVFLHIPQYGRWSIAQVTGGYRYEISKQPNVYGQLDYGHIRDVELVTEFAEIDPVAADASEGLRRSMRLRSRMWSLDAHSDEIDRLVAAP